MVMGFGMGDYLWFDKKPALIADSTNSVSS